MLEVAGSLQKTPLRSENLSEVTWNQYNGKGEGGKEGEIIIKSHTKPQKAQQSYLEDMLKITEQENLWSLQWTMGPASLWFRKQLSSQKLIT